MKRKHKKLPLSVYLASAFLGFSALLLVVLWLFQTVFLDSFYKGIKTQQVKTCAYSLADYIDSSNFYNLINDIETQNGMSVSIYDTDSPIFSRVYTSDKALSFNSDIAMSTVYELYNQALDNNGEYSALTHASLERRAEKPDKIVFYSEDSSGFSQNDLNDFGKPQDDAENQTENGQNNNYSVEISDGKEQNNENEPEKQNKNATSDEFSAMIIERREPSLERESAELMAYAMIVSTTDGERLIVVQSEITPVSSVVDTLRIQLIIMTVVIILLSLFVAVIISKLISKPISKANNNAKSLAKQKYDIKFEGGRYREITELNDTLSYAASELKKVDSLQKELIANISHDLRTPLTMITGYSEVMRDLPGEMTPENIQIIIDEATRLNSLVTDLLDISRLQSGTANIKKEPFSLTKCIESIFTRYTKLVENDGLKIVFEKDNEVFILGDELRMTQVLYNLINNAINHIGEDKTVIVRQRVNGDKVTVQIIDHGEGIPEDKLKYIWDRYYRVDKEHKRAVIGTGLGLSIVKNILIAHDADFGAASKLGEGSDFYFTLPIIQ